MLRDSYDCARVIFELRFASISSSRFFRNSVACCALRMHSASTSFWCSRTALSQRSLAAQASLSRFRASSARSASSCFLSSSLALRRSSACHCASWSRELRCSSSPSKRPEMERRRCEAGG